MEDHEKTVGDGIARVISRAADLYELAYYGFERISRSDLPDWAEEVSDDEELSDAHKSLALRFIGEFADHADGCDVVAEFTDPIEEPISFEDATMQAMIKRLMYCGYVRIAWERNIGDRLLWGLVLGHEVWKRDEDAVTERS